MKKQKSSNKLKKTEDKLKNITSQLKIKAIDISDNQAEIYLINESGIKTYICEVQKLEDKFYIKGEEGLVFTNQDECLGYILEHVSTILQQMIDNSYTKGDLKVREEDELDLQSDEEEIVNENT